jgi:hypothetical protein
VPVLDTLPDDGRTGSDDVASRIALSPSLVAGSSSDLRSTLAHEVAHVATSGPGTYWEPRWMIEGVAEYTAWRSRPESRSMSYDLLDKADAGVLAEGLPDSDTFYDAWWHYDHAWLLCTYIAEHWDEATLRRLYVAMRATSEDLGEQRAQERAIRRVLQVSVEDFTRDFAAWAQRRLAEYR